MKKTYWAAEPNSFDFARLCIDKLGDYRQKLRDCDTAYDARRCWLAYYGYGTEGDGDTSRLMTAGENGQLTRQSANILAEAVDTWLTSILRHKPGFQAVAKNGDASSMSDSQVAAGIMQEYDRRLSLNEAEWKAVKAAALTTMGWVALNWNGALGEKLIDPDTGIPRGTGDVEVSSHTVFDVAFDWGLSDVNDSSWVCIRRPASRWELVAKYPDDVSDPDRVDKILSIQPGDQVPSGETSDFDFMRFVDNTKMEPDSVWVYEFRHKKTLAMPKGRRVLFLTSDCVLYDSLAEGVEYPYGDELFCYPVFIDKKLGTPLGHTPVKDMLSLQESHDLSLSAIATAIESNGVQNWWTEIGSGLRASDFNGRKAVIQSKAKPELIMGAQVPPDVYNYLGQSAQMLRSRLAISDVVAGDVPKGMPAQGIAAMQAQFAERHGGLASSYVKLTAEVRTGLIRMLQMFAENNRTMLIVGKANSWQAVEFNKDKIRGFDRFQVEPVSPDSMSVAGRTAKICEIADRYPGSVNVQQFTEYIATGQINFLDDEKLNYKMRLVKDCELLRKGIGLAPHVVVEDEMSPGEYTLEYEPGGKGLKPLITDNFPVDIETYMAVLNAPDARANQQVSKAVLEVIGELKHLYYKADPFWLAIRGIPPPPPVAPPEQMGQMQPLAPQEGAIPQGGGAREEPGSALAATGAVPLNGPNIKQPSPPRNPITGEQPPPPMA